MNKKDELLAWLIEDDVDSNRGFTADEIAHKYQLSRSVISRYFNQLVIEDKLVKTEGRPVRFRLTGKLPSETDQNNMLYNKVENHMMKNQAFLNNNVKNTELEKTAFELIGTNGSLRKAVKQAQAAVLYPPNGLHTLVYGETGVGKSLFAREMYRYALVIGRMQTQSPFVVLNCADYADNPQLLMGEIFGVKKGAFTGADKDREGLLQKADGGILFLDEVHRLPPQGQEMLFTFMDYGHFRSLGSNQDINGVKVQIIAATTENPESVLLATFKRRIPIFIELPALNQRTLDERMMLIKMFIKQEAIRIDKPIAISRNAFIALLLYECKSNIGQLKTDIQQACAKAFLNYVSNDEAFLKVKSIDLSTEVKSGYNAYKTKRNIIDQLLPPSSETIRSDDMRTELKVESEVSENFYVFLEEKIQALKSEGADEETIRQVVGADIENKFSNYIRTMKKNVSEKMIAKVVEPNLIALSSRLMDYAGQKLNREIPISLRSAFTLHMASAVERIQNHQPIYNPKLNQIRIAHMEEFLIAMDLARDIEMTLGLVLPIDEIGYITMFLLDHEADEQKSIARKIPLLIIMHGKSTASSMAEVVNELIGETHVTAFDMPLSMSVEDMYKIVSGYILEQHMTEVLLMVDMGSLCNFGEMLYEDYSIHARTLSQCSTPIVLEVARKVTAGLGLDEIYKSMDKGYFVSRSKVRTDIGDEQLLILTACFTGEGTAERMKRILEKRLTKYKNIQIASIDLADRGKYLATIDHYKSSYRLIAIASTLNIPVEHTPVFSALDLLQEEGLVKIERVVEDALLLDDISKSIQESVEYPSYELVKVASNFIDAVESNIQNTMQPDARIGFLLHVVFYIDNRLKGKSLKSFDTYKSFLLDNGIFCEQISPAFKILEHAFSIQIPQEQRAFLCKVILANLEEEQLTND